MRGMFGIAAGGAPPKVRSNIARGDVPGETANNRQSRNAAKYQSRREDLLGRFAARDIYGRYSRGRCPWLYYFAPSMLRGPRRV